MAKTPLPPECWADEEVCFCKGCGAFLVIAFGERDVVNGRCPCGHVQEHDRPRYAEDVLPMREALDRCSFTLEEWLSAVEHNRLVYERAALKERARTSPAIEQHVDQKIAHRLYTEAVERAQRKLDEES